MQSLTFTILKRHRKLQSTDTQLAGRSAGLTPIITYSYLSCTSKKHTKKENYARSYDMSLIYTLMPIRLHIHQKMKQLKQNLRHILCPVINKLETFDL